MSARSKLGEWPMPDTIPGVIQCRGGWFAIKTEADKCGSGPWRTEAAALAAMVGNFEQAERLERNSP